MVDATQLWVSALGAVCVALALIVFYAVRKVLVLKEDVEKAKDRLTAIEALQKETAEILKNSLVPEVEKLKDDQKEVISRLSGDIRDLNASQLMIHTKVNEQDLRVKSISSLVNQLSVQQQETLRMGLLNNENEGGNASNGNSNGNNNNANGGKSTTNKGGGGTNNNNTSSSQNNNNSSVILSSSTANAAELSAIIASVLFNNSSGGGGDGGGGALGMLGKAIAADSASGAIGAASGSPSVAYGGSRHQFALKPPSSSTLMEILTRHRRIGGAGGGMLGGLSSSTASFHAPPVTTIPPAVVIYHLTMNPSRLSSGAMYRKKTMRLQFSVGPRMEETAICLMASTATGGGVGGAGGGDGHGGGNGHDGHTSALGIGAGLNNGVNYGGGGGGARNGRRSVFGGGNQYDSGANTWNSQNTGSGGGGANNNSTNQQNQQQQQQQPQILLYLSDIIALSMSFEPLPVDETDSVCFTLSLKRTERSTHHLLMSGGTVMGGGGIVGGGGGSGGSALLNTSSANALNTSSTSTWSPTTITAALGGGGGAPSSHNGPVEVILYAPACPSVEEWVVFLHSHLGDRVRIKDDLL